MTIAFYEYPFSSTRRRRRRLSTRSESKMIPRPLLRLTIVLCRPCSSVGRTEH
jgi:hypothetical protein